MPGGLENGVIVQGMNVDLLGLTILDLAGSGIISLGSATPGVIRGCMVQLCGSSVNPAATPAISIHTPPLPSGGGDGGGGGEGSKSTPSPAKLIEDNLAVNNFGEGLIVGGIAETVQDILIDGNILLGNGLPSKALARNLEITSSPQSAPMALVQVLSNVCWQDPDSTVPPAGGAPNSAATRIGYSSGAQSLDFAGNILAGPDSSLDMGPSVSLRDAQNNYAICPTLPNYWDRLPSNGNNKHVASPSQATGTTVVTRVSKDVGRTGSIAILNFDRSSSVSVDLSVFGIQKGDRFRVRDAQNPLGTPLIDVRHNGQLVSIPMTTGSVLLPHDPGSSLGLPHTPITFGVFLVELHDVPPPPRWVLITLWFAIPALFAIGLIVGAVILIRRYSPVTWRPLVWLTTLRPYPPAPSPAPPTAVGRDPLFNASVSAVAGRTQPITTSSVTTSSSFSITPLTDASGQPRNRSAAERFLDDNPSFKGRESFVPQDADVAWLYGTNGGTEGAKQPSSWDRSRPGPSSGRTDSRGRYPAEKRATSQQQSRSIFEPTTGRIPKDRRTLIESRATPAVFLPVRPPLPPSDRLKRFQRRPSQSKDPPPAAAADLLKEQQTNTGVADPIAFNPLATPPRNRRASVPTDAETRPTSLTQVSRTLSPGQRTITPDSASISQMGRTPSGNRLRSVSAADSIPSPAAFTSSGRTAAISRSALPPRPGSSPSSLSGLSSGSATSSRPILAKESPLNLDMLDAFPRSPAPPPTSPPPATAAPTIPREEGRQQWAKEPTPRSRARSNALSSPPEIRPPRLPSNSRPPPAGSVPTPMLQAESRPGTAESRPVVRMNPQPSVVITRGGTVISDLSPRPASEQRSVREPARPVTLDSAGFGIVAMANTFGAGVGAGSSSQAPPPPSGPGSGGGSSDSSTETSPASQFSPVIRPTPPPRPSNEIRSAILTSGPGGSPPSPLGPADRIRQILSSPPSGQNLARALASSTALSSSAAEPLNQRLDRIQDLLMAYQTRQQERSRPPSTLSSRFTSSSISSDAEQQDRRNPSGRRFSVDTVNVSDRERFGSPVRRASQ